MTVLIRATRIWADLYIIMAILVDMDIKRNDHILSWS